MAGGAPGGTGGGAAPRGRIRLHRLADCPLLPGGGDAAAFEAAWALLPGPGESEREFAFVDGWFVKGTDGRGDGALRRWRRVARTVNEARGLLRMAARGIPVPEVAAWGVETAGGIPRRALLVERALPGVVKLGRFLADGPEPGLRRRVLGEVGRLVGRLHGAGMFHRDLAVRNVLVRDGGGGGELGVWLIDCPRAARPSFPPWRAMLRRADLLRLARGLRARGATEEEVRLALPEVGDREFATLLSLSSGGRLRNAGPPDPRRLSYLWFGADTEPGTD